MQTLSDYAKNNLTAVENVDGWIVTDASGGVWHPTEHASDVIASSDDPERMALLLCDGDPLVYGCWVY